MNANLSPANARVHAYQFFAIISAIIFALFIYWPGLSGPFLIDDQLNIFNHTDIQQFNWHSLYNVAIQNESGPTGRPISALTFALTRFTSGDGSFAFKYQNLMLHLICGILLFWLTLLLASSNQATGAQNTRLAAFVALLWVIHPLHASTALYAVQRMTILASLFSLAALICYVKGRSRISSPDSGHSAWPMYAGCGIFALFALLSKESAATLPLLIILIEWVFYNGVKGGLIVRIFLSLYVVIPALSALVYYVSHFERYQLVFAGIRGYTLSDRLMSETTIAILYLKQALLPRLADFSLFHDDITPIKQWSTSVSLSVCLLLGLFVVGIKLSKTRRLVSFGILWFIASHLLESTVLPLELMFDHRNYLASYGPLLLVGDLLLNSGKYVSPKITWITASTLLIAFSFMTRARVIEWSSADSIATISQLEHPNSWRAIRLNVDILMRKGDGAGARQELRKIVSLLPGNSAPLIDNILTYCLLNQRVPASAVADAKKTLGKATVTYPYELVAIDHLIAQVDRKNCPGMEGDQLADLTQTILNNHQKLVASNAEANFLWLHAKSLKLANRYAESRSFFLKAFAANPDNIGPIRDLVNWQIAINDQIGARATLDQLATGTGYQHERAIQELQGLINAMKTPK